MSSRLLSRSLLISWCGLCGLSWACSSDPEPTRFPGSAGSSGSASVAGGGSSSGGASAGTAGSGMAGSGTAGMPNAGAGGAGAAGAATSGGSTGSGFPNGTIAAVSLTYDDGLDPDINVVAPQLDAKGFKATFFLSSFEGVDHNWALPNSKDPLKPRHQAWQAMLAKGHELADHTVNHPCAANKAPGFLLKDYDLVRMTTELDDSIARLKRLGVPEPITFGYPCSSDKVGLGPSGTDYSPLVATRFLAARVSDDGIADPKTVDLLHVPQMSGQKTGPELKAMVDQAIAAKGWLVITIHGVGPEQASCPGGADLPYAPQTCMINYLATDTAAHQALIDYLDQKKAEVWTAPFGTVAKALEK